MIVAGCIDVPGRKGVRVWFRLSVLGLKAWATHRSGIVNEGSAHFVSFSEAVCRVVLPEFIGINRPLGIAQFEGLYMI